MYRAPVVLCYLEAMSYQAAAARLGVSEDAVRGRLRGPASGCARRLARRGIEVPAIIAAARPEIRGNVRHRTGTSHGPAAISLSVGGVAGLGAISRSVISLTERTCRTMMLTRLKACAAAAGARG